MQAQGWNRWRKLLAAMPLPHFCHQSCYQSATCAHRYLIISMVSFNMDLYVNLSYQFADKIVAVNVCFVLFRVTLDTVNQTEIDISLAGFYEKYYFYGNTLQQGHFSCSDLPSILHVHVYGNKLLTSQAVRHKPPCNFTFLVFKLLRKVTLLSL